MISDVLHISMGWRIVVLCIFLFLIWGIIIFSSATFTLLQLLGSFFIGLFLRGFQYFIVNFFGMGDFGGLISLFIMAPLVWFAYRRKNMFLLLILFGYLTTALFSEHLVKFIFKENLYTKVIG